MNKQKYFFLFYLTVLAPIEIYSQSRIDKKKTDVKLELDFICQTNEIAIQKIALKGTKDTTTNNDAHSSNFLVYNTAKRAGILPGYYYWYGKKWNNLKNIIKESKIPMLQGAAGDIYVDLSTRDVYFHNGSIWITKMRNDMALRVVKFEALSGILTYLTPTGKVNSLDLSKILPNFGKTTSISLNVSRKTINYINDKGASFILDLRLLTKNKF